MNRNGFTIWFTGLSESGKTTVSRIVIDLMQKNGLKDVEILDGDVVRTNLSKGLGFSKEDRDTNIRRIGWVAQLLTKHGVPNIVAAISPHRDVRNDVRNMVEKAGGKGSFIEVFVDCPIEICEQRDSKGLYSKARRGEIRNFTGIDQPYEHPEKPEVHIRTDTCLPEECAEEVLSYLRSKGLVTNTSQYER